MGRRDESRLYRVDDIFKALPIRIIRVEALGHKMGFDLMTLHENPSHFGRTGVDDQSHAVTISAGLRLMSNG